MMAFLFTLFFAAQAFAGYSFPLNIIVVEETNWSDEDVVGHIKNVEKIFGQCDLRPDPVQINRIAPPFGYTEFSAPKDQEIATIIPESVRPVLFFMDGYDTPQAYGADEFAEGSPRGILSNTAWISQIIKAPKYIAGLNPAYDPVAHELAHILCNCGHVEGDESNLLSGKRIYLSDKLTPEQCKVFQKSPLVRKDN